MFTTLFSILDVAFDILFGVAKKLIGWAALTAIALLSVLVTICIILAQIIK